MNKGSGLRQGLGLAFRLGVELMVATLLGAAMGYAADYFLDTQPWFLAVGVILGGMAGCLNAYRAAMSVTLNNEDDDQNNSHSEGR